MKAKVYGKELYPVGLLVALFMMWGLVGIADAPYRSPEREPSGRNEERVCRDEGIGAHAPAFCAYPAGEQAESLLFDRVKRRSSSIAGVERELIIKNQ